MSAWDPVTTEPDALGESPFWHPHEKTLYWVDIPGRRIRRCHVSTGTVESWAMPSEPGCIAPARRGGLVIALRDGIYRAVAWGGPLTRLVEAEHDTRTMRFNDGKCDRLGRFWVGSMYEPRDRRLARLYCVDLRDGRAPALSPMPGDNIIANGLDWSPDNGTLYWADTDGHVIHAWGWEPQANRMSGQRVLRRFPARPEGWAFGDSRPYGGRPDGATVDSQGNYWVAMFEGQRLLKLSASGETLAELPLPAQCPTMPCFGGEDLRTLYVTTASHNRPEAELAALPLSGCVLGTRVEVAGQTVNFFED